MALTAGVGVRFIVDLEAGTCCGSLMAWVALIDQRCALTIRRLTEPTADRVA